MFRGPEPNKKNDNSVKNKRMEIDGKDEKRKNRRCGRGFGNQKKKNEINKWGRTRVNKKKGTVTTRGNRKPIKIGAFAWLRIPKI